jgi:aminopeptidase N
MVRLLRTCLALAVFLPSLLSGQTDSTSRFRRTLPHEHHILCHHVQGGERPEFSEIPDRFLNYDMSGSIARSDTFDIASYELTLDVTDYLGSTLTGHARIALTVLDGAAQDLWFDLVDLTVDSLHIDGVNTAFVATENAVHVSAPAEGWNEGAEHEVEVWYGGQPYADPYWGGFYFTADYIYNLGIGLTTIPPNFGKVWHPCFDNFVERATYTYHVTTAGGRTAHCQGTFLGETLLGGDTIQRSFELTHPITTHQAAIAAAPYVDSNYVHTGEYGDIPVRLTAKPGDINAMVNKFVELGYAIDALEYWWGPYAWERVGYVLTTDGALEIPTNIAYPVFMVNQGLASNGGLFSHELGHHWWGDLVSPMIHNHMWLKEGPAEYSSHLFVEWKDGPEAFIETVKDNQLFVLEQAHVDDNGFHPMSPMPDEEIYGRHTYYKGASVLHNLRAYLGDELYRSGMQAVIAEHYDSYMDAEMFAATLTDVTGVNMAPFFDAQIFQPGFSTWVVDSLAPAAGPDPATTLFLQQKLRACENYHFEEPLDVKLYAEDGSSFETSIVVGGQFAEVTLEHPGFGGPVTFAALNETGRLNQGRMDLTYTVADEEGIQSLPWVEMRVGCDYIPEGDSAIVRIEHQWAAPDAQPVADYVDELSSTHFWVVDGVWPEGLVLDARLQYDGSDENGLDFDLYGATEADAFLAWRPAAGEPWVEYPDYEWQAGSLSNGGGLFRLPYLLKGQYTFANGDVSASISAAEPEGIRWSVHPNPTTGSVTVSGFEGQELFVRDASGQIVARKRCSRGDCAMDLEGFADGVYFLGSPDGGPAQQVILASGKSGQ